MTTYQVEYPAVRGSNTVVKTNPDFMKYVAIGLGAIIVIIFICKFLNKDESDDEEAEDKLN